MGVIAVLTDPEELRRWVADASATTAFWASAPAWRSDVARTKLGGDLLVWSDSGVFAVAVVPGVVAVHLLGKATLSELADDFAAAAEVATEQARDLVANLAVELAALGAIDGVALPEPQGSEPVGQPDVPAFENPATGETRRVDLETGHEMRVVTETSPEGYLITTEYLPDGRRRVSTTMTFDTDRGSDAMVMAEVLAGDRSAAELVPADSCLGSKLRLGEDAPLMSFRGPDGKVRSVRCDVAEVLERLRSGVGEALVQGDRGPVEAFVVAPLEGDGPVRVYDGHGRRRGRPRSVADLIEVIDQVLGERIAPTAETAGSMVPLAMTLLGAPDGSGVLVPRGALDQPLLARRLEAAGWTPTWADAVVDPTGAVSAPRAFGSPAWVTRDVQVLVEEPPASALEQVLVLMGPYADTMTRSAARLDRIVDLARRARWGSATGELAVLLSGDAAAAT